MIDLLGDTHPVSLAVLLALSLVVLVSGAAVVTRKGPVAAVAWLVVHFVATAGIYLFLDAEFLAVIQVLVYAGAIMVLFLFVVMLLAVDQQPDPGLAGGIGRKGLVLALIVGLVAIFAGVVTVSPPVLSAAPLEAPAGKGTVEWLADALFSRHLLAFELASIPLLAAMAGVLVYTTRRARASRAAAIREAAR